jgi:RNA-binding protein 25
MRERKRLERRLREKELAYRERLKAWETREAKKRHDYDVEKRKEHQRKKQVTKDAKRLKQFLEDYDDVKDDPVHYKGASLERKLKAREKEIELDNKDRQREREELEELKRKLTEKGLEDVESEIKRVSFHHLAFDFELKW